jgi:hypothetical protein
MPTKKQRRRQQKARRHEYEYVYVDDEGNEVEVDPDEVRAEREAKREPTSAKGANRKPATRAGSQRTVQPPSWRRSLRRGVIIGPLLVAAMMLFNRHVPLVQQVAPAAFLLAFFIPFSYFTDSLAYRMYRKRLERRGPANSR